MLARRRYLKLHGRILERTPLMVPSFSSKGFPEVREIIEYASGVIEGPALLSAYDLHYSEIVPPFDFASLLFLDSGGYEASKDLDLSDYGDKEHLPREWSRSFHETVLENWQSRVPSVLISYDHPNEKLPIPDQIARARALPSGRTNTLREILLKPQKSIFDINAVISHVHSLADFDVIGVTEKEIGSSLLDRMTNIGRLRMALENAGLDTPIHIFGSLDPITSPLYFLAGADIFDGLTWLRFAFQDGRTLYKQNYGATIGVNIKAHILDGVCWNNNYRYLQNLQQEMRAFLQTENYNSFKHNSGLFRSALDGAMEAIGAANGR